jgi:hypothetical protein
VILSYQIQGIKKMTGGEMKKIFFIAFILAVLLLPVLLNAQWAKTYGDIWKDRLYAITETQDDGFVAVGSAELPMAEGNWIDTLVMKLSREGELVWSRTFGWLEHDWFEAVFPLDDGGYIVAGSYEDIYDDLLYSMILKLDAGGTLVWRRIYAVGGQNSRVESAKQTKDGGIILLGIGYAEFVPEPDITVTKLNAGGDIVWSKAYEGYDDDFPSAIQQTEDGGYIVAASSRSYPSEERDGWLMRLDPSGEILWQKRYTGGADEWVYDVQQTKDLGFILAGWTKAYGAGETDCWILKILENGDIEWQRAFGGSRLDAIHSVVQTGDDGYVVAGVTTSFGAGSSDGLIAKLTPLGEIEWQRTCGGLDQDVLNDIIVTSEGGFITAGYTTSFGKGEEDAFVLYLDSKGNIGSACSLIASSTPQQTLTMAISDSIGLVTRSISPTKEFFDLYQNYPNLMAETLCRAEKYTLTIQTTTGGTTSPSPGSYIHSENSEVNIQGIPQDQTWLFDRWSGDIPGGSQSLNPLSLTMDRDREITAHFKKSVSPPLQFTGQKVMNRSLSQIEYIHVLSWAANPDNRNIAKYRIYLVEGIDQTLLAEVSAKTLFYWHRHVAVDRAYQYAVTAVNESGVESEAATTTIQLTRQLLISISRTFVKLF